VFTIYFSLLTLLVTPELKELFSVLVTEYSDKNEVMFHLGQPNKHATNSTRGYIYNLTATIIKLHTRDTKI
jgi:hypothetical protein